MNDFISKLLAFFKDFISKLFSSGEDVSMKRFVGLVIFIVLLNLSYLAALGTIKIDTWKAIEGWLRTLLYSADLLLGLGAVLDGAKIIKSGDTKGPVTPETNPNPDPNGTSK